MLSFEVGLVKPQPEIFHLVCEQLGLLAEQILFVGDASEADVLGPRAIGMHAMTVSSFQAAPEHGSDHIRCSPAGVSSMVFASSAASYGTDYRLLGTPKPLMVAAGQELNDHRLIRYREESGHYSRFMPWHAAAEHRLDLALSAANSRPSTMVRPSL